MTENNDYSKILKMIYSCSNSTKLNNFVENAIRNNVPKIRDAAIQRLAALIPNCEPGTLDYDFWNTIRAHERVLRDGGKTTVHLFRTRQKAETSGIEETLSEWVLDRSYGWTFNALVEVGHIKLTGESVVSRHSNRFDDAVVEAANERLEAANFQMRSEN